VTLELPGLELKSENWWRQAHPGWLLQKQRDREKKAIKLMWFAMRPTVRLPCVVTLTRRSPSARGLDSDGLQGSCKYVRDALAALLGLDDADPRVQWAYRQDRGPYGLTVRLDEL
jgi:hypothetical protein